MKLLFIIFLLIILLSIYYLYNLYNRNDEDKNKEQFNLEQEFDKRRDIDWALGDWFCKENPNNPLCKNVNICKQNPNIPMCKKLDFDIQQYCKLNPNNCKPKVVEKIPLAMCFSGGGSRSMASHHGIMTSIMKKLRNNDKNANYNTIFKNVDSIAGISGGSWYLSMLLYNKQFNRNMNSIVTTGITKNNVFNIYKTKYTDLWYNKRLSLGDIQEFKDLLDLPFFIEFFVEVIDRFSGALKFAIPWQDFISKTVLLDQLNNVRLKNPLEYFKNKNILFGSSIMNNGNVDIKNDKPLISYSLKSPICDYRKGKFPCHPGPINTNQNISIGQSSSGNYQDVFWIEDSRGNNFNDVYWWDGYNPVGNPNFDNTVFDTCAWTEMYMYDWQSGQVFPAGLRTWRCFNVACAECCRNNSTYNKCPMAFPVTFSSKNSVPFSFYNDIPIQYVAYNYETEKNPTGEPNYFDLIDTNSRRMALYDRNGISFRDYNSSEEFVNRVAAASSAFASFANEPCYIKSQFYGSGWSDQEKIFNKLMHAVSYVGIPVFSSKINRDSRVFNTPCSVLPELCPNTSSCGPNNMLCSENPSFDWRDILMKINDKGILRLGDGGNVDGLGILNCIHAHITNQSYTNKNKGIINIISVVSTNFDNSVDTFGDNDDPRNSRYCELVRAVFKNFNPFPGTQCYDIGSKDILCDLGKTISDTINGLAELSLIEEIGIVVGSALVTSIVDAILVVLGGIVGTVVAIGLTTIITDVVYELLDMDTDDHLTTDYYGKTFDTCSNLYFKPTIFNHNFDNPTSITNFVTRDNKNVYVNLIKYKNIKTIENELLGIDGGITVNLYILQSFLDITKYPRAAITETIIEPYTNYAHLVANVFDCCMDNSIREPFREIIELLE